jgi:hypothetical protein
MRAILWLGFAIGLTDGNRPCDPAGGSRRRSLEFVRSGR